MAKKPRRVDYYNDPKAPKPNSRKPSASVVVRDEAGRVLLLRRTDNHLWTIPTGGLKRGETIRECAARECQEETGMEVETLDLVGVFSDPCHVIAYRDGEVRQPVNVCLFARVVGGSLVTTDEAADVQWIEPHRVDDYPMAPPLRRRLRHALDGPVPHID